MKIINKYVLFVVLAMGFMSVNAQSKYTSNSIGFQFGTTSPYTDVRSHQYFRTLATGSTNNRKSEYQPFFGLHALHMFSHVLGVYVDGNYGKMQGVVSNRNIQKKGYSTEDFALYQRLGFSRQIYSKTTLADASINMYINFTNLAWFTKEANSKNAKPRKLGVYGYAGVGMVTYDANVYALATKDQTIIDKETYYMHGKVSSKKGLFNTNDLIFPTALGVKYNVTKCIDLGLEASMRFTATDKLDAVSDQLVRSYDKTYQATVQTVNNANRTALPTSRYQGYAYDKYAYLGLKVSFKLGGCNVMNNNIEWNDPEAAILKNVDAEMGKLRSLLNDSDKDGVSDAFDKEANTPAGVKVDGAGQALDVDADGVADYKDDEPFSPKGATVNETGIAADADNDGVADVKDLEPNTKANALVNFRGVTIGSRESAVKSTTEDKPLFIFPSVYFDLNSSYIRPQYHDVLADAARSLIKYQDIKINIYGNCDLRGNDEINNDLGRKRADAVANYMRKNFKIDASRIKVVESNGKMHPISNEHRPNRRVDILLAE
jgi:outer membrane protein OmpA-like peptidoglycan-associated protein